MTCVSLIIGIVSIVLSYNAAVHEVERRLVETSRSQARLMESIAKFSHSQIEDQDEASEAALTQITEAHRRYNGFGKTGEFTLAEREGSDIVFLLSHRHTGVEDRKIIALKSNYAEPMQMVLNGHSGSMVGRDYRGVYVLAAYEPVDMICCDLGLVAKMDIAEIRSPFIRAGVIASSFAVLVILVGSVVFIRALTPIFKRLHDRHESRKRKPENTLRKVSSAIIILIIAFLVSFLGYSLHVAQVNDVRISITQERLEASLKLYSHVGTHTEASLKDFCLEECIRLTGSRYGYIGYVHENDENTVTVAVWSENMQLDYKIHNDRAEFDIAEGIAREAQWAIPFRTQKAYVNNDFGGKPMDENAEHPAEHKVVLSRYMSVPVFTEGKCRLIIGLGNKKKPYTQDDVLQVTFLMEDLWQVITIYRANKRADQWRRIIEMSDTAYIICDAKNGTIAMWNDGAQKLLGWTEGEAIGRKLDLIIPPGRFERHQIGMTYPDLLEKLNKGGIIQVSGKMVTKDGEEIDINIRVMSVINGRNLYVAQVVLDEEVEILPTAVDPNGDTKDVRTIPDR